MTGTEQAFSSSFSTCASASSPVLVRSPAIRRISDCRDTSRKSEASSFLSVSLTWISAMAATRIFFSGVFSGLLISNTFHRCYFIPPFEDIGGILSLVDKRPAADLFNGPWYLILLSKPFDQPVDQFAGNDVPEFRWINELKDEQLGEQQMPMSVEPGKQPVPVDVLTLPQQHMIDIRAVESFPVLDVRFTPDELFHRDQPDLDSHELRRLAVLVPGIVDLADIVGRIENDIHEAVALEYFGQPAYIRLFGLVSQPLEGLQQVGALAGFAEDVEVFGIALNARVRAKGETAADEEWLPCRVQLGQHFPVKGMGLGFRVFGIGHVKGC